jgi:hypothetical protein
LELLDGALSSRRPLFFLKAPVQLMALLSWQTLPEANSEAMLLLFSWSQQYHVSGVFHIGASFVGLLTAQQPLVKFRWSLAWGPDLIANPTMSIFSL